MSEMEHSRESCHMKVATFKDWLLNADEEFINMDMESSPNDTSNPNGFPPQQQNISNFEFQKEGKQSSPAASTAKELFLEGKLLPLETVRKSCQNNAAAAIDHVRSQSAIEDRTIPRITDSAASTDVMSPSHSCRFSSSDANLSEYQFQFPADFTKGSWSQRLTKQTKQSWLVQKLKVSREFIKSLFAKSAKDKPCPGSASSASAADDNAVSAGNKATTPKDLHGEDKNVEDNAAAGDAIRRGSFEKVLDDDRELRRSCADAIDSVNKGMHDDGGSRRRRSSFSGVLKRQFSSRGSFSMSAAGSNELRALKRSISAAHHEDPEKSVDGAIAHCRLSQQTGIGFRSKLMIAPKVAASGNQDVAALAGKAQG